METLEKPTTKLHEKDDNRETYPIYENFLRVDNVSIFDHRVIGVIKRVNDAPMRIRNKTEQFLEVINNLKRIYTRSLAKRTKASERYTTAVARYERCEKELYKFRESHCVDKEQSNSYDNFNHSDESTSNNSSEKTTSERLEYNKKYQHYKETLNKCHVELLLARNILDSADREVDLYREQLCLFTKKAEHSFMCFLRRTTDNFLPHSTVGCSSQSRGSTPLEEDNNRQYESSPLPPPQFLRIGGADGEGKLTPSSVDSGSLETRTSSTTDTDDYVEDDDLNMKEGYGSGGGFEWDATFDDHLHTYEHLPMVSAFHHDNTQTKKIPATVTSSSATSDGEEIYDDDDEYDYDDEYDTLLKDTDDKKTLLLNDKSPRNGAKFSNGSNNSKTDYFQSVIDAAAVQNINESRQHQPYSVRRMNTEPLYDGLVLYRRRCVLGQVMRPSRVMKYLRTVIHGPWEGWEDL